jgi:hypothetical protein
MCNSSAGVLKRFTSKERRFIKGECDRILNAFKQTKGYNPISIQLSGVGKHTDLIME